MIGTFGHISLISALILNIYLLLSYFLSSLKKNINFRKTKHLNFLISLFIFLAFIFLLWSFATSDFSNMAVYQNSHSQKPLFYKISGSWGNHEGSMVLFILILSLFSSFFSFSRINENLKYLTIFFQNILILFFLIFLIFTSNPFDIISPTPIEGLGLNPILQDPLLSIHPPFLYVGYVGFSIIFSFALAGLYLQEFSMLWSKQASFWIIIAWTFLTIGIGLGSIWAYYELGWGGFWFWDPVENASLVPWLASTALLHSNIASMKTEKFLSWTALLAIVTFTTSLLGTFLVRSGILNSVHAFANDPDRGLYILAVIIIITFFAFLIFILKFPKDRTPNILVFWSRGSFILINNCFMIFFLVVVMVGTLYPIFLDAIFDKSISVGPNYYNALLAPFVIVLLWFMAHGPLLEWYKFNKLSLIKIIFQISFLTLLSSLIVIFYFKNISLLFILGVFSSLYLIISVLFDVFKQKVINKNLARIVSHFGFGILIFSIFINSFLSKEIDVPIKVGQTIKRDTIEIQFKNIIKSQEQNFEEIIGNFLVKDGTKSFELSPSLRKYFQPSQVTSETSIKNTILGDYYLAINLSEFDGDKIMIRFYHKPLMMWIWISIILIILGGLLRIFKKQDAI